MTTSTDPLVESTAALAATYSRALGGGVGSEDVPNAGLDLQRMPDAGLLAVVAANFDVVRKVQALLVQAAGELNDRFEHDSGIAARTLGRACRDRNRNAAAALTDVGHISMAEAGPLVKVGAVTKPRTSLIGDGRTIQQLNFDAFVDIVRHALSCNEGLGALDHTTVIVRMSLESLQTGIGEAQLDGIEQPISASTARKMAVEACLIPMVLGGTGAVLDFGLGKRPVVEPVETHQSAEACRDGARRRMRHPGLSLGRACRDHGRPAIRRGITFFGTKRMTGPRTWTTS